MLCTSGSLCTGLGYKWSWNGNSALNPSFVKLKMSRLLTVQRPSLTGNEQHRVLLVKIRLVDFLSERMC